MIVLSRRPARDFWAVLRRCLARAQPDPVVVARAGPAGLTLHAVLPEVALRLNIGGVQESAEIAFPASLLAGIDGDSDEPVRLESDGPGRGRATVPGASGCRELPFDLTGSKALPAFPELPKKLRPMEAGLLRALHDATQVAAKERVRFAVDRLLLSGKEGAVVATDSKQMLVQTGFAFPWDDALVVPRLDIWDAPALRSDDPLLIGRSEQQVVLRVGRWTVVLKLDTTSRYPPYAEVLPRRSHVRATLLSLPPEECKRLLRELPRLPGRQENQAPVLLVLEERVLVVGQGRDGSGALELPTASFSGPPVRAACDRRQLLRALRLGFPTLHIQSADKPLFARDERRTFLFMPVVWDGGTTLPATMPRAAPASSARVPDPVPSPVPEPDPNPVVEESVMPVPPNHPRAGAQGDASRLPAEAADPLVEAEELRSLLQAAHGRVGRLLAALKHFRRHSRAVSAAVASLRQLPPLTP